jgi:hypothetical protein
MITECEHCRENTIDTESGDHYQDESGYYHDECQESLTQKEMDYHLSRYTPKPASEHLAYEWGDPKNADYMEWVVEQVDSRD